VVLTPTKLTLTQKDSEMAVRYADYSGNNYELSRNLVVEFG